MSVIDYVSDKCRILKDSLNFSNTFKIENTTLQTVLQLLYDLQVKVSNICKEQKLRFSFTMTLCGRKWRMVCRRLKHLFDLPFYISG